MLPFYQKKKYPYLVACMSRLEYITHDKNHHKCFTGVLYNHDNGPFKNKECGIYNLKWVLHLLQQKAPKLACFELFFKIINIFLKNNICILN